MSDGAYEVVPAIPFVTMLCGTSFPCYVCHQYLRGCFSQDGIAPVRLLDTYHMMRPFIPSCLPCTTRSAFVTTDSPYISGTLASTWYTPYTNRKFIDTLRHARSSRDNCSV